MLLLYGNMQREMPKSRLLMQRGALRGDEWLDVASAGFQKSRLAVISHRLPALGNSLFPQRAGQTNDLRRCEVSVRTIPPVFFAREWEVHNPSNAAAAGFDYWDVVCRLKWRAIHMHAHDEVMFEVHECALGTEKVTTQHHLEYTMAARVGDAEDSTPHQQRVNTPKIVCTAYRPRPPQNPMYADRPLMLPPPGPEELTPMAMMGLALASCNPYMDVKFWVGDNRSEQYMPFGSAMCWNMAAGAGPNESARGDRARVSPSIENPPARLPVSFRPVPGAA